MAWDRDDFHAEVKLLLGDQLNELIEEGPIDRWVNQGKDQLGARYGKTVDKTWIAADPSFDLPTDFGVLDRIVPLADSALPIGRIFGGKYWFDDPDGASEAGSCRVFYWTQYPDITDTQSFLGQPTEQQAVLSWVLYRFYTYLASSRAAYRRYSTLAGQSVLSVEDLKALANDHLTEFADALGASELRAGSTFFGD
jgi:hypothetical protein